MPGNHPSRRFVTSHFTKHKGEVDGEEVRHEGDARRHWGGNGNDARRVRGGRRGASPTLRSAPSSVEVGSYRALGLHGGDEVASPKTFAETFLASDFVAVGSFEHFEVGRMVQGDAAEDQVHYLNGVFKIDDVLRGDLGDEVTVEFLTGATGKRALADAVEDLTDDVVGARSVVFLHAKGGIGEEGKVRLTSSYGLVTATDRAKVDVPLGEVPAPPFPRTEVEEPATAWATMDQFVEAMAALRT
ncbi:hypothetical protein KSP35_15295 [Aquihabitans sp. G128]|uniref:hypothetical protein n=1 Tax=Aquihabitans sp. G128 TaxID=2849779 RepID=UPI001C227B8F|nr:hypothetical protein [Aquihabitans sp. G128]QXC59737.1 hypothetical protein KSP35_15295 [Aquihabitans sp. G128]